MTSGPRHRKRHEERNHRPYSLRHAFCALLFSGGAAAGKNLPRRFPRSKHCFRKRRPSGCVPARVKQAWLRDRGKNITIEYRFGENKGPARHPELAADLVHLKVDLIVVSGVGAVLAAKKATTTIPFVMVTASDPMGAGLVASLARPGGNVTGNSGLSFELNTKRLEILKDAVPKLARVGLLLAPGANIAIDLQLKEFRPAALALKLKLEEIKTPPDAKGLESAFQTAKQKQVNAIMTTTGRTFFRRKKADRRTCRQIPVACYLLPEGVCRRGRSHVLRGGLR